jgi:hypothetical protein
MSGGIATPPSPPQSPTPPVQPVVPQESPLTVLIQDRIYKTRRQVKGVDIIAGLLTLIVGALTYLFAAALADHWLVTGGLGFWGRLVLWVILISAAGLYFVKFLWPSLVLSINPVFAARTIEQCKPSLKNSLINFLLLRGRQSDLAPVIYQALEQRAASDLKDVQIETAVDRRPVLRLSYLLLAVVGVICLYLAISPKSPITSAQRVLWPWSGVRAPTRVTIENVQPGDTTAFHGDFVTVSADVMGLKQGEIVLLHYSTADGEILDQVIPMTEENNAYRRQAKLPPDTRGLQQDYSYFITAGDCKTATYHIHTQIPPFIDVDQVDYHYPSYTGIPDRSIRRQGDIRAIEGTQITIHAAANQPIERAEIDFSGAGMPGIRMDARDRAATGHFPLRMLPDDPTRQEHDFYQLRFTDINHRKNRQPILYKIEVLRPLEVQIVEPQKDETSLPQDGKLEIRIRAEDLYFGLCRVALRAELEKQSLKIPPLLDAGPPEKPISGEFRGKYEFDPKRFNLKPGDRVAYWAEAEDNKEPSPNLTATGKKWIVIVPPDNPQTKDDQQPHRAQRPGEKSSNDASQTQKNNQQPNDGQSQGDQKQPQNLEQTKPGEKGEKGEKGDGSEKSDKSDEGMKGEKGGNGEKGEKSNEGMKGEKGGNGEKGEKSNEGMKGEKGEKGENRDQAKQDTQGNPQQQAPDQSQSGNQGDSSQTGKNGDKSASPDSGQNQRQPSGDQAGKAQEPIDPNTNPGDAIQEILKHRQEEQQKEQQKTQPGEQQQNNQQQSGNQQSGNQQPKNQQSGNQQSDNQQTAKQQSGKQQSGNQQTGGQQSANQQTGNQQTDNQKSSQQQPTGNQSVNPQQSDTRESGKQPSGNQPAGTQQSGGQQSENKQPNNSQPSENQQPEGNKQSTDQTPAGQQQTHEKQPSGNQQPLGDKQTGDSRSAATEQPGEKKSSPEKQMSLEQQSPGDKKSSGDAQRSGSKQGDQQPSAEKQQSDGKQSEKQPADGRKPGAQDQINNQRQTPGAGQMPGIPKPSSEAQGANQPRAKQPGQPGQDQNKKQEEGQSPGISPKQSNSKGDSSVDRSGDGQQGGGQQANQPGPGSPGSQATSDKGGSKSNQQGPGETGNKPGDQTQSTEPAGSAAKQQTPQGSNGQKQPGGEDSASRQRQSPDSSTGEGQQKPAEGTPAGNQLGKEPSAHGSGNPTGGGQQGPSPDVAAESESRQSAADAVNLDFARKQTILALEHLEDQLAKDQPELLERLGWTREQAQRFIDRWQQLREAADEKGARGEAAKKQLDDALKSLGLRPGTTVIKHGGTKTDQLQDLRDSGRFKPPQEWAEQFREYTRGVANQGKEQRTGDKD